MTFVLFHINLAIKNKMKYKVHRIDIIMEKDQHNLEQFLNSLKGEVVSIIPNIKKTSLAQIYGLTNKIDFLLVVEKRITS